LAHHGDSAMFNDMWREEIEIVKAAAHIPQVPPFEGGHYSTDPESIQGIIIASDTHENEDPR
jgi:hypothetical protein